MNSVVISHDVEDEMMRTTSKFQINHNHFVVL